MKFTWKYIYVPEGQMTPDEHNRWAIAGYISVNIKAALPEYSWMTNHGHQHIDVCVTWINQKGTLPGDVPSTVSMFAACCPSVDDAANIGLSGRSYFFSDDIEELKKIIEEQFNKLQLVFKNCE